MRKVTLFGTSVRIPFLSERSDNRVVVLDEPEQAPAPQAAPAAAAPRVTVRSADWITVDLPLAADFDSVNADCVEQIPANTTNPEEVPTFVATTLQPLMTRAKDAVSLALGTLKNRAASLRGKAPEIKKAYDEAIAAARNQFKTVAEPHLTALHNARADKAKVVARLRTEKSNLPKQIEDYEYGLTGDRRIRVDRVDRRMLNAITALLTSVIGGMDLVLASAVFIIAKDDATAYIIGAAYALALGFAMHQRAVYGAQIRAAKEAREANRFWLDSNSNERGNLMPLAESIREGYFRWTKILVGVGSSMAIMRVLVAGLTGKWGNFVMSFIITLVAFGIALFGSEILMKVAPKFGEHHDKIGDMKDRLAFELDEELHEAEAREIPEPAELSGAKTQYATAVYKAKTAAQASVEGGEELLENATAILKQEADFNKEASNRFVGTCKAVLEFVMTPEQAEAMEKVNETDFDKDLLTHFMTSVTLNPFAGQNFGSILPNFTETATAEKLVSEMVASRPVVAPVPPPAPAAPTPRVKLNFRKR